jgi:hypothetical protein
MLASREDTVGYVGYDGLRQVALAPTRRPQHPVVNAF